jgi:hypothetical protein
MHPNEIRITLENVLELREDGKRLSSAHEAALEEQIVRQKESD